MGNNEKVVLLMSTKACFIGVLQFLHSVKWGSEDVG